MHFMKMNKTILQIIKGFLKEIFNLFFLFLEFSNKNTNSEKESYPSIKILYKEYKN